MSLAMPLTGARTYVTIPSFERFDLVHKILPELEKAGASFRLLLNLDHGLPMCGISFARNLLVSKALEDPECEYIVNLSNDVFDFTPDWLKTLISMMSPDIGAITAYNFANYEAGKWITWKHDGTQVSYDTPEWDRETMDSIGGQISIMQANALRKVGLYDLKYGLGSYEGIDLGQRMVKAGYVLLHTSRVRVKHDIISGNCDTLGKACQPWLTSGPK